MAELQTDINVKIKLGDEKTASGESNLPAIDKGSIVITKDTNRIYIDTIDDVPERIEIGENKQDKFANVTNPGICKVTMSNSGQTYFCNNSSDSGIYFDSSIRLLQGKGIKNNDDLVNKKYVDDNSGAGKKFGTSEIFNDYENNIVWNTKYDGGILVTDLTATIVTLENVEGLAVGGTFNIYSLTHDYTSNNLTITAINTSTNKVTFSPEYAGPPLTVATLYVVNSTATKTTKLFYKYAHAEGYQTKAINNYSHAEGIGTIAGINTGTEEGQAQTAVGMYNATNPYTLFMVGNGTSKNARNNAFEVYRDGHATVQTMGMTDNSVVIKSELNKKQDKFATVTTANTIQTVKIGDDLSIVTSPNFGYSQISSTKILTLSGADSDSSYVSLRKTKLENNCDFDATQGYLRVRDNPLADDFAVNKKYVDDIKTELLNAITHPYTYDETTKELTLIL